MLANELFPQLQEGTNIKSLFHILQLNEATEDDIQPICHSPYHDLNNFKLLVERNNESFSILSCNIKYIN